MLTKDPTRNEGTDSPLDGETDPDYIPSAWAEQGTHQDVDDNSTRYYAVRQAIEHNVSTDPDVLAGRTDGRAESYTVHVQYIRGDGSRAVDRQYPARVVDRGDHTTIEPRGLQRGDWPASIAVDGTTDEIASIERTPAVVRGLEALHGLTLSED